MGILLVRHARAGQRHRWKGDDRLRPLSKKGRVQAAALPALIEPWTSARPPVLLSSPWVRCVETLGPLAAALDVPVETEDILGEGMGPKAVEALGRWLSRRPTVVCSHGDVIEEILTTLAASGVDLGAAPSAAKGSVWVLDGSRGAVRRARYLPPLA
ncbi:MAG TPA: phosphoglycerate mutase family protein [Acidimicrobiales bacterium]